MTATIQNQSVPMCAFLLCRRKLMSGTGFNYGARTLLNRGVDEHDPENREHRIQAKETQQSEQARGGVDVFRVTLRRAEQSVDEPWLATDLGSHPAGSICNIRQRETDQD